MKNLRLVLLALAFFAVLALSSNEARSVPWCPWPNVWTCEWHSVLSAPCYQACRDGGGSVQECDAECTYEYRECTCIYNVRDGK